MSIVCFRVEREMQEYLDAHGNLVQETLSDAARQHLAICARCRSFADNWKILPDELAQAIDYEVACLPEMRPPAVSSGPRTERYAHRYPLLAFAGIAAAMLVIVGLFAGYRGLRSYRFARLIREENGVFLQEIFDEPLLDSNSVTALDGYLTTQSSWFAATAIADSYREDMRNLGSVY